MSKEPSRTFTYYTPGKSIVRRIDQDNKVEIYDISKKEWRHSIAAAYIVRKDTKITEGKAMEIIAFEITTQNYR